jgi:hypothetical protein
MDPTSPSSSILCGVVSAHDVSRELGISVSRPHSDARGIVTIGTYSTGSPSQYVQIEYETQIESTLLEGMRASYGQPHQVTSSVPGIGKGGFASNYIVGSLNCVAVYGRKGTTAVSVVSTSGFESTEALTRLIVTKLGNWPLNTDPVVVG